MWVPSILVGYRPRPTPRPSHPRRQEDTRPKRREVTRCHPGDSLPTPNLPVDSGSSTTPFALPVPRGTFRRRVPCPSLGLPRGTSVLNRRNKSSTPFTPGKRFQSRRSETVPRVETPHVFTDYERTWVFDLRTRPGGVSTDEHRVDRVHTGRGGRTGFQTRERFPFVADQRTPYPRPAPPHNPTLTPTSTGRGSA